MAWINLSNIPLIYRKIINNIVFDDLIHNDLNSIANSYGISKLSLEAKAGGFSTNNYFAVADGIKIFIKQFQDSEIQKIIKIEDVTINLSNNGILTPGFQLNTQKQTYTRINNVYYVVYPNVEGNILHHADFDDVSLDSIAFHLAKLHQIKCRFDTVLPSTMQTMSTIKQIDLAARNIYKLLEQIEDKLEAEKKLIEQLIIKKLQILKLSKFLFKNNGYNKSLVHGDFHNENIIIKANANVAALLDFEMLHYGHPIEDVINFIQLACCNNGFDTESLNLARLFLSKYRIYNKYITNISIAMGVEFYLYKMCSSFFLEHAFILSKDSRFLCLLERDLNKLNFLEKNIQWLIDKLCA